jgi:hypothetical protein
VLWTSLDRRDLWLKGKDKPVWSVGVYYETIRIDLEQTIRPAHRVVLYDQTMLSASRDYQISLIAVSCRNIAPAHAKFLTEDEKKLALYRMQVISSSVVNEPFFFRDALAIPKKPTSWVILAIEVCLGVPLQSVALFLPGIIARLGYATVKTNLYTVAPNITGAVMLLILGFASGKRGFHDL